MIRPSPDTPFLHGGEDFLFGFKALVARPYDRRRVDRALAALLAAARRRRGEATIYAMPWAGFEELWFYGRVPEAARRRVEPIRAGAEAALRQLRRRGVIRSFREQPIGWTRVPEGDQHQIEAKGVTFEACARQRLAHGSRESDDEAGIFGLALACVALRAFCRTKAEMSRVVRVSFMRAAREMRASHAQAEEILRSCARGLELERARATAILDGLAAGALTTFASGLAESDLELLRRAEPPLREQGRRFRRRAAAILRERPLALYQVIHPPFRVLNVAFERELLLYGALHAALRRPLRLESPARPAWAELVFPIRAPGGFVRALRHGGLRRLASRLERAPECRAVFFVTERGPDLVVTAAARSRRDLSRLKERLERAARGAWPAWMGRPEARFYAGRTIDQWGGRRALPHVERIMRGLSAAHAEAARAAGSPGRAASGRVLTALLAVLALAEELGLGRERLLAHNAWWTAHLRALRKDRDDGLIEAQAKSLAAALGGFAAAGAGTLSERVARGAGPRQSAALRRLRERAGPSARRLSRLRLTVYDDERWGKTHDDPLAALFYKRLAHGAFLTGGLYASLELVALGAARRLVEREPGPGSKSAGIRPA